MSGGPLRVAVLGYGLAGRIFHAPLIAATPGLSVAAIVTGDEDRAGQARRDHPNAAILPSADALWAQADQYDVAVIAAPNRAHVALGIAALEAGLAAVVDKPVATSVAGAHRLIEASRRTGMLLTVYQNRRWDADFRTLRRVLESGAVGRVTRFESRYERYRPEPRAGVWRERGDPEEGGGLLYDLGSHLIDQALQLFGLPTHVYAELDRRRQGVEVDDDAFVALHFAGGMRAHLWASAVAPIHGPRFRVLGTLGGFEKHGMDPQEAALHAGHRPDEPDWGVEPPEAWGRLTTYRDGLHVERARVESLPGAYPQFYALLRDALVHGSPPPVAPAEALDVVRVIEAAAESARAGSVVALSDAPRAPQTT